ncbi:MAG: NAD-dependent deacylase [Anaerolineae bacterium]
MTDQRFKSVVVLTGAGISAESGVPTFRGEDGLWRQYRAEDLATPQAFAREPTVVWEWYDWRRGLIAGCEPNAAHHALVQMERSCEDFTLITQNVDDLHLRAGSERAVRLHGSIWQVRCTSEGTVSDNNEVPLCQLPPRCQCGALLRPHVVWFGETLDPAVLKSAYAAAERCDLMLVVGTSAVVHPAASLPVMAKSKGAYLIEVNLERTPLSPYADEVVLGPAAEELPRLWARLEEPLQAT